MAAGYMMTGQHKADMNSYILLQTAAKFFNELFSSPEPKARVSYCYSAPSVVCPSVVRRRPSSSVNFHIFDFFSRTA